MDQAHEWTDEKIEELTERIHQTYEQAKAEMEKKLADWPEEFQRQLKELDRAVEAGEMTRRQRNRAVMRLQTHEKWLGAMVDDLSEQTTLASERAAEIVNDALPGVCAESMNFATFQVEQQANANTMWTLVDEDTVRLLVKEDRDLLPSVEVGHGSAKKWNARHFQSAVTQGILQGESIPDISARLVEAVGMSEGASVRAARTACTGAENAGRTHSFQRANAMGIGVLSEWRATLDMRTRPSHRALNGERVRPGDEFSNGCVEPGDPSGPAWEVWNCRCTLVPYVEGTNYGKNDGRWFEDKTIGGMTYDEWVNGKKATTTASKASGASKRTVVDGKDILGTWKRRPDMFDFEIEDVMAAQGFDGKPRIVDADDFDRAVKEANGGNGLIMQRTYTGPDKEIADSYREMLYDGKWYVDCSTGGAQYGQGMYAAADYSGTLTDGIRSEMQHYIDLGKQRNPVTTFDMLTEDRQRRMIANEVESIGLTGDKAEAVQTLVASELQIERLTWEQMVQLHDTIGDIDYTDVLSRLRTYRGEPVSYVETMTLDPSAKVITWNDAMKAMDDNWDPGMPGDIGSYAAAMGYDAINAVGHGASGSYTVVLNRTKLIIRRPE